MESETAFHHDDAGLDPDTEALARVIIGAAIDVHRVLGPGLPESVYRKALSHKFNLRGIEHTYETPIPVLYKGILVGEGRMDMLVEKCIVIELKTVEALTDVHRAQLIAYLHACHLRLGFLINYNVALMRDGVKRILNPHYV
jgi:GxxExxY protein